MNVIFIGPPGSGKGTMAARIVKRYEMMHISTGDMLRENMRAGTDLGKLAQGYIDKGQLVPDAVIIGMVEKKLLESYGGALFDGFPRTESQATALLKITDIDAVIELEAPLELVTARMLTRKVCRKCGKVFSTKLYKDNFCDECGGELYHRSDDEIETIKARYMVYLETLGNIKKVFEERHLLYTVDADDTVDSIEKKITEILDRKLV
ncbi:MAG: nucleoside monophosphate kinase [Christensenellaceae bacterium]|jgi:adenylate kinase|nr:nucleoside monophosphate kinase [Christensenellaceae bacterium]